VLCPLELNDRMIALDADPMRCASLRFGVSCGVEKALPNIGAARSRLINVPITDEDAATTMLRLIDTEPAETRGRERP
jgi:DNA-binding transcriptional regulator LsrR (DeoR family)